MVETECIVESLREEMKESDVSPANLINIVGPIDQQAAPDHDGQKREVDPVKPANRSRMLRLKLLQCQTSSLNRVSILLNKKLRCIRSNDERGRCADPF